MILMLSLSHLNSFDRSGRCSWYVTYWCMTASQVPVSMMSRDQCWPASVTKEPVSHNTEEEGTSTSFSFQFTGVFPLSQCCFPSCVFISGYQWLMSPPSCRTLTLVMTERMMIWWSITFSIIFIHDVELLSETSKVNMHKNNWKVQNNGF